MLTWSRDHVLLGHASYDLPSLQALFDERAEFSDFHPRGRLWKCSPWCNYPIYLTR
jgi:hypothetical protein